MEKFFCLTGLAVPFLSMISILVRPGSPIEKLFKKTLFDRKKNCRNFVETNISSTCPI